MIGEPQETFSPEVTMQKAWELYGKVKPQVETPGNIGKFIVFDVPSGDYEINRDHAAAVIAVRERHDNAQTGSLRIGYTTTYSHGGRMRRTA